jgi:hypothetical protein
MKIIIERKNGMRKYEKERSTTKKENGKRQRSIKK